MRGRSTRKVLSVFRLSVFSDPAGIRNGRNLQKKNERNKGISGKLMDLSSLSLLRRKERPLVQPAASEPISATLTPLSSEKYGRQKPVDLGERRKEVHGERGR